MNPTLNDIPVFTWHHCYDKRWESLMVKDAFVHPAKFSPGLIDRIYTHGLAAGWWRKGDTVGDPFGGVAGGGIYAGYHGLNWVGVELEQKFVDLGNRNIELHGPKWMALGDASRVVLLQGDSRRFAEVVAADAILTSPPYADALNSGGPDTPHPDGFKRMGHGVKEWYGVATGQIGRLKAGAVDAVVSSPPFLGAKSDTTSSAGGIQQNGYTGGRKVREPVGARTFLSGSTPDRVDGNIEKLEPGRLDAVLTSPPYDAGLGHGGGRPIHQPGRPGDVTLQGQKDGYGGTPGQIGALGSGSLDGVVTSPPFGDEQPCASQTRAKQDYHTFTRGDKSKRDHVQRSPGNIATLGASGSVDAVVTSPPWEDTEGSLGAHKFKDAQAYARHMSEGRGHSSTPAARLDQFAREAGNTYGNGDGQIGTTTGETYWQAMHQVYGQCLLALKPGGVMAVVVKDYVKDKARVPLCDQTMRLLLHLGFEPVCRIHAMLVKVHHHETLFEGRQATRKERKSFFRRLAEKKGSPRIDHEEVLVVRKPEGGTDAR